MEPDRPEVVRFVESVRSAYGEREEVVEDEFLGAPKSSTTASSSSAWPRSMSRVARAAAWKRKSSAERAFQHPPVGSNGDQPTEEKLERDALPEAGEAEHGLRGFGLEPVVERLAERGWVAYLIDPGAASRGRASFLGVRLLARAAGA